MRGSFTKNEKSEMKYLMGTVQIRKYETFNGDWREYDPFLGRYEILCSIF